MEIPELFGYFLRSVFYFSGSILEGLMMQIYIISRYAVK